MSWFKRTALWFCGTLFLLPAVACALSGAPVEGKVVEDGTSAPVANALVVVVWEGAARARGRKACLHVESAVTDEHGDFRTRAWHKSAAAAEHDSEPVMIVHKPGYRWSRVFMKSGSTRYLKPAAERRQARLSYLWRLSRTTECRLAEESQRNLLPLKRALYEEAREIAIDPEELETVKKLLAIVEEIEQIYGPAQAPNHEQRGVSQ